MPSTCPTIGVIVDAANRLAPLPVEVSLSETRGSLTKPLPRLIILILVISPASDATLKSVKVCVSKTICPPSSIVRWSSSPTVCSLLMYWMSSSVTIRLPSSVIILSGEVDCSKTNAPPTTPIFARTSVPCVSVKLNFNSSPTE